MLVLVTFYFTINNLNTLNFLILFSKNRKTYYLGIEKLTIFLYLLSIF